MHLASASTVLKIHDFPSGELINTYAPTNKCPEPIRSISWSRDGTWLAILPPNGITEIVTFKDKPRPLMSIRDIPANCVMFPNTSRRTIVLGTTQREVLIYDVKTKRVRQQFEKCPADVNLVDYTAQDTHIVAALNNGEIFLFSNTVKKLTAKYTIPKSASVTSIRCSYTKRNYIVGGSSEGIVALFDSNVNKVMFSVEGHVAAISGLAFSPINLDLIVSTGLDRQLIFYDFVSRSKVAQIPLENSPTSVDFAHDGIHLAVSGQNGKIYMYDMRSLNTPTHFFEAHSSRITKVAFQKSETNADGSFCIPLDEETPKTHPTENESDQNSGYLYHDVYGVEMPVPQRESDVKPEAAGDSFMAAIGMHFNESKNESSSCTNTNATVQTNPSISTVPQSSGKKLLERQLLGKHMSSSTPKCFSPEVSPPKLSPVFNFNQLPKGAPQTVTKPAVQLSLTATEIREIVRDEVKHELEKVHKEMQYGLYDIVSQIRRHFLELQMSLVKEFLQLETNLNKLKQELLIDEPCCSEDLLIQENYRLKRELLLFKGKIMDKNKL